MVLLKTLSVFGTVAAILSTTFATPVANPEPQPKAKVAAKAKTSISDTSSYWLANIARNGKVAYGDSGFTIYRNVVSYGADPTGATDSTAAINAAIADGSRCGLGCDSSTVTPAIVYFPPGTYLVSKPIQQYYYTQLIGDAINPPTLKASASFTGMAVIDSDPYEDNGANWFTNQNNFFRQVRNFVIDLTGMPATSGAGIHWQVAQATSLQNIVFNMIPGASSKQIGIFMDNGSGGFMTDLVFNGGNYGAFFGNQQFTSRNMTFNNCNTAIFMNWNWVWTLQGITVNNCGVALDLSNGPAAQLVGSVSLIDSTITGTPVGVKTAYVNSAANSPTSGGTLILDNVDFTGCGIAVQSYTGTTILQGGSRVKSFVQGTRYVNRAGSRIQDQLPGPTKPGVLLNSAGQFFTRSRPQYETVPLSSFVSVKSFGAAGDGVTDDTAAIQKAMNAITSGQILYFDHGAYVVTSTVVVPATIKITGEIWPLIMASGSYFADPNNPKVVFQVGTKGQTGAVEISDLIFETKGAAPGAIMMEWNLKSAQGASGIWDVHWRIGGSAGTGLQSDACSKNPSTTHAANPACEGAFLLFHATSSATGVYLENTWLWVADHELDLSDHNQIDIYNGRGMLIESKGPVWLWGTSSEHSVLYNYQLNGASNVFMGHIQSETPYFQSNPAAPAPFTPQLSIYNDPNFAVCTSQKQTAPCYKSWGLRVVDSDHVYIYGTGLYSFFENYSQDCVTSNNCQLNMISVQGSSNKVFMYAVSTKASVNMITLDGVGMAQDAANRNAFCATLAQFTH